MVARENRNEPRAMKPLSAALSVVVADLGGGRGGDLVRILDCWADVVGGSVADHTRIRGLSGGVLSVVVDHPGWATQLRYLRSRIAEELNSTLGSEVVSSVDIRVIGERPGRRKEARGSPDPG